MAVGQIFRSQPFFVTWENSQDPVTKGDLVIPCTTASGVKKNAASAADFPPYGVALATAAAAGTSIPVCWQGIVEVTATTASIMYNNQAVYSATAGKVTTLYTTAIAEGRIVGFIVDATTAAAEKVKIRLGAW